MRFPVHMAERIPITDVDDPRLVDYRSLKDTELRKRYENEAGVFIAEGPNVVLELLSSRFPARSLLLSPERAEEWWDEHLAGLDAPVYLAERPLLEEIVRFRLHQGAIAVGGRMVGQSLDELLDGVSARTDAPLLLVLEEMNDHENMGSLFRTARGLGADAVLVGPRSADPLYRRCVRVSMGHALHVPFTSTPDLEVTFDALRARGIATVALTPAPDAVSLDEVDLRGPTALVLGAEGPGLSAQTMRSADVRVRVPMAGDIDSLNVSVTAAVVLAEAARQRRTG